jgi:hypothetical protein
MDHPDAEQDVFEYESIKSIDADAYARISQDACCLLAMSLLEAMNVRLTFENITVACFRLFPSKFSLPNFPKYPDSYAVHNSVNLHMQYTKGSERHWVRGNKRQGYTITEQGRKEIEQYLPIIGQKSTKGESRRLGEGELRFIQLIKASEAYKKYHSGKRGNITDEDVCFMLRFPVGEDPRIAMQQLVKALTIADKARDQDLESFLHNIEASHKDLFAYRGETWKRR